MILLSTLHCALTKKFFCNARKVGGLYINFASLITLMALETHHIEILMGMLQWQKTCDYFVSNLLLLNFALCSWNPFVVGCVRGIWEFVFSHLINHKWCGGKLYGVIYVRILHCAPWNLLVGCHCIISTSILNKIIQYIMQNCRPNYPTSCK